MRIAMLAPFEETVPPQKYGGTELVVYNLIEEFIKTGHELSLFATGESKTNANLIEIFPGPIRGAITQKERDAKKIIGIGKALSLLEAKKFDIVHNHIGWRFLPFIDVVKSPVVTTLHGPLTDQSLASVYNAYAKKNYISISLNQRKPLPNLNFVANVYNGIEHSKFTFSDKPKDYLAFLGRMSPEKGPLEAIQVAKTAKKKLVMAAKIDETDKEYFNKQIRPHIDGREVQFIGEIDHQQKDSFLSNAEALLAPIQWEEPFGLVITEAMACGTPVIALNRGSVPEIIKDKETGFICPDLTSMASSVKRLKDINRFECRKHIIDNFSTNKMAEDYIQAYQQVLLDS